jgi:hypothetical protein
VIDPDERLPWHQRGMLDPALEAEAARRGVNLKPAVQMRWSFFEQHVASVRERAPSAQNDCFGFSQTRIVAARLSLEL